MAYIRHFRTTAATPPRRRPPLLIRRENRPPEYALPESPTPAFRLRAGTGLGAAPETPGAGAIVAARRRRRRRTGPAWRRWLWASLGVVGVGVLVVVAYAGWVWYSFTRFQNRIYVPLPPTASPQVAQLQGDKLVPTPWATTWAEVPTETPTPDDPFADLPAGRINVLLLGTDVRPNDPTDQIGRSDTMILANLDTVTRQVRVLTIPRDLAVNVPGYGLNKINAAYFLGERFSEPGGGPGLAMKTVSKLLNVPIDYYATIDFAGFRALVDSIGGIDINVPYEIYDPAYPSDNPQDPFGSIVLDFKPGWQHMDGATALRYARTRHQDTDFMRSKRQLQVIMAIREKALHVDVLPRLPSMLDQLGGMITTNVPPDKQVDLLKAAYQVQAQNVITASIDNNYVSDLWLPDGSEALELNWQKARPMLDSFFGRTQTAQGTILPTTRPSTGQLPILTPVPPLRPVPTQAANAVDQIPPGGQALPPGPGR